jgi:hypothetical protein
MAAIAGSLLSTLIAGRCPRVWPITFICVAQLTALFMLLGSVGHSEFWAAVLIISFVWYFSAPFQLGITVEVDHTGRCVVLFLMAMKASYAIGPIIASRFIVDDNYEGVAILGIISTVAAFLIYTPLAFLAPGTHLGETGKSFSREDFSCNQM